MLGRAHTTITRISQIASASENTDQHNNSKKFVIESRYFKGDLEKLKSLSRSVSVDAVNPENGQTATIAAAEMGRLKAVEFLIAKGADLNVRTKYGGLSALHVAVQQRHKDIVQMLLEAGIDRDLKSLSGQTALQMASSLNLVEITKIIKGPTKPNLSALPKRSVKQRRLGVLLR